MATFWVSPSGVDSNPGTSGAPFRSIQAAANSVNPGDTVIVRNGLYTDHDANGVVVNVQRGGTSANWVTFKSENQWGAVVDGQNTAADCFFVGGASGGFIRIEGFEIKGAVSANGGNGIHCFASNLVIYRNNIHDIGRFCSDTAFGQSGIYSENQTGIVIDSNVIHDIGRFYPGENGCSGLTTFNYENHDHGYYFNGGSAIIKNNVFYNCKSGWPLHLYNQPISNSQIINNTIVHPNLTQPGQIILGADITTLDIANNIFYNPTTSGVQPFGFGETFIGVTIRHNIIYDGTALSSNPGGITLLNNQENTDPLFVNVSTTDFHLTSGSPAKDAGLTLADVAIDLDGVARPQGAAYDMGAYEFTGAPPPPPPPANPLPTAIWVS